MYLLPNGSNRINKQQIPKNKHEGFITVVLHACVNDVDTAALTNSRGQQHLDNCVRQALFCECVDLDRRGVGSVFGTNRFQQIIKTYPNV